jgi:hypothetical protein
VERVLASLSTAWSFREPISVETVGGRDAVDLIVVMEALKGEAWLLREDRSPQRLAEDLLSGLATGRVPDEFAETHLMALTGWDWATLQETPADLVERMAIYLAVKLARGAGGALDFPLPPSPPG